MKLQTLVLSLNKGWENEQITRGFISNSLGEK